MNAYLIECTGGYSQNHIVIANSYWMAERLWLDKYNITPKSIKLFSKYVIIQEDGHDKA